MPLDRSYYSGRILNLKLRVGDHHDTASWNDSGMEAACGIGILNSGGLVAAPVWLSLKVLNKLSALLTVGNLKASRS